MFKRILFFVFIFSSNLGIAQELTATQNFPNKFEAGKSYTIETIIKKGSVTGFMKFAQVVPEGTIAVEIDNKGGSFSFVDNTAKIVWVAPPSEDEFKISYKLTISEGSTQKLKFSGKISYINNNERIVFDLPTKEFSLNETIENKQINTTEITPTANNETKPIKENKKTEKEPIKQTLPKDSKMPITAIPSASGKTYRVQIGAYSQKPKIEDVPEITTLVLDNGITKYFSGNFDNYDDANKRKKQMVEKGFEGAFIVQFENGKIIK